MSKQSKRIRESILIQLAKGGGSVFNWPEARLCATQSQSMTQIIETLSEQVIDHTNYIHICIKARSETGCAG